MEQAVNHWQANVHHQDGRADTQQPHGKIQLCDEPFQSAEPNDRNDPSSQTESPNLPFINQRRLADQNERHEHQQVFQTDQQRRVVPNAPPSQEDSGQDQQQFITLERSEVEIELRNFLPQEIGIDRNAMKPIKQQRRADQVKRIARTKTPHPVR